MANLTSKDWRDLIFQGKNKEFGAYQLRKNSEKRHTLAVIFTLIGLVIVILAVIGYSKWSDWRAEQEAAALLAERERMSQIEMAQEQEEEDVPEEEPEEQKFEQELPEVKEEVLATVQVTQIQIVDADKVQNEVMDMDRQKEDNTARGVVTQEGSDDADKFEAVKEQVVVVETPKEEAPPPKVPEPPKEEEKKPVDEIFQAVEQPAEFPGGQSALNKWLSQNIRYPESAQQNGVSGRVVVRFVVERDGSISGVTVLKGVDKDLDAEATRVVKKMPKWQAGKNNGQSVRSYFTLPVTFKLQNQ